MPFNARSRFIGYRRASMQALTTGRQRTSPMLARASAAQLTTCGDSSSSRAASVSDTAAMAIGPLSDR